MVHGFTRNKIALTYDHHFITVNKIVKTYKQLGLTSLPHKPNCPVNKAQMLKSEVSILDLKAIEQDQSSLTEEHIFGHFLSGSQLKKRELPNVFLKEQVSSNESRNTKSVISFNHGIKRAQKYKYSIDDKNIEQIPSENGPHMIKQT